MSAMGVGMYGFIVYKTVETPSPIVIALWTYKVLLVLHILKSTVIGLKPLNGKLGWE